MLNQELLDALRNCAHHLHRMSDGRASQRRLMGILGEKGELSQRELLDIVGVKSATLSEVLGKIESAGLIERRASEEDRRNVLVSLTERGKQVAEESSEGGGKRLEEMFSCLTETEKQNLLDMLTHVADHWSENFPGDMEHPMRGMHRGERRGGRPMGGGGRPPMREERHARNSRDAHRHGGRGHFGERRD